jgi:hypothetical protein
MRRRDRKFKFWNDFFAILDGTAPIGEAARD